jgi:adenylate cyclase, class 2
MGHEIEAKLRYEDHEGLKKTLMAAGAQFAGDSAQKDVYFDDAAGSIRRRDGALRIRHEMPSGRVSVTLKGPHEVSDLKRRMEVNLDVSGLEQAHELLTGLGYSPRIMIEKNRSAWQLGGCEVALDELPLIGRFVEIEGPDEAAISRVQAMLGLGNLKHIPWSYAALVEERNRRD